MELAEEEPDAVRFAEDLEMPEGAELSEHAQGYWSAWHRLTHDRQMGAMGGASRIPWSSIERYADSRGFDDEILARMCWAMDDVYLELLAEKQKAPEK